MTADAESLCCARLPEGRPFESPFSRVLIYGWYDGATCGVLQCGRCERGWIFSPLFDHGADPRWFLPQGRPSERRWYRAGAQRVFSLTWASPDAVRSILSTFGVKDARGDVEELFRHANGDAHIRVSVARPSPGWSHADAEAFGRAMHRAGRPTLAIALQVDRVDREGDPMRIISSARDISSLEPDPTRDWYALLGDPQDEVFPDDEAASA